MMKRRQFGPSSEKTEPDLRQITLYGEIKEIIIPMPKGKEPKPSGGKKKGKREEDLSGLPIKRVEYTLSETERACPECGETMGDIGAQTRRELEVIPAQVIVVEHAAHTYACGNCKKNNKETNDPTPIIQAEPPAPIISGSLASPSLVAHIISQKYSNGMPLYRMETGFQYDGVVISRQTMANWVIKCAEIWLAIIYQRLKAYLLKETTLHADETTVQVLREVGREPQTKSYEWVYRTSGCSEKKIVIYDYKETRKREHPQKFLKDFKGYLHTDGYEVYHGLPPDIVIVGCWAHV
jgi:transposase